MATGFSISTFRSKALVGEGARANLFDVMLTGSAAQSFGVNTTEFQFACKAANIPAMAVGVVEVPYFGRVVKVPGNKTFENWSVTIINDEGFLVRNGMEKWIASMGTHIGNIQSAASSALTSALYGNAAKAVCIDNWITFPEEEQVRKFFNTENQKKTFETNTKKVITEKIDFQFIESDFRKINFNKLGKFNIYCYDALHDRKSQYDGITIAQPALDDIFTIIIDDWNLKEVRNGTLSAFGDLGVIVISKIDIKTTQNNTYPKLLHSHYSEWHNGYFIAVCKKSK